MEKHTETIYINHTSVNNCNYYDNNQVHHDVTSIEAMALLISRIAGTIQYSDDNDEKCEYEIVITKKK